MSLRLATNGSAPKVLTEDLALENEVILGGIIANNYTFITAMPTGPYTGSKSTKVVIQLPQELISFKDAYLEFQITGSAGNTAGIECSFVPDIRSIISRMDVLFGGKTILSIDQYGLLQNVMDYSFNPLWANYNGSVLVASDTSQVSRQGYFTNSNKIYSCKISLAKGMENLFEKILPLNKMGTTMQINLFLSDPSYVISTNVAVTGTVAPSYTVNQVELHYITFVPTSGWDDAFNKKISSNPGITFTYRGFDNTIDTTSCLAGSTSTSKVLTPKFASLLGLFIVFQLPSMVGNYQSDVKMQYFYNPNLTLLRLRIGGQFYPTDQTCSDSDVFGRYLLMMGKSTEDPVAAAEYWNYNGASPAFASYVACCPISKHPNSIYSDDRVAVTGLDTSIATSISLDLGFGTPLASNLIMNIWSYYEATITFNRNGSLTLNT